MGLIQDNFVDKLIGAAVDTHRAAAGVSNDALDQVHLLNKGGNAMEVWKTIPGYKGFYEVSDQGRVRSITRPKTRDGFPVHSPTGKPVLLKGGIKKVFLDLGGYRIAHLCKKGKARTMKVSRLVLITFVGPRLKNQQCRHLDGNKLNDKLTNLRWGTYQENLEDRIKHGTIPKEEKHQLAKLTNRNVLWIRKVYKWRHPVFGGVPLAKKFGVCKSTISAVLNKQNWKTLT
jgi:hypothetical protein